MIDRENQIIYADRTHAAPPAVVLAKPVVVREPGGGIFRQWYDDYNSWLDEHGYASGALEWATANLQVNDRSYYFDTSHHELDRKKVAEGYIKRTQKRGQHAVTEMRYTRNCEIVTVNDYEMTVARIGSEKNPHLIYRPFLQCDRSKKFRLVHEKVNRTYSYDELPVYVNYLMVSAKRAAYLTVENKVCHYHAVIEILDRLKPLSKFNSVPVTPELALLYQSYCAALSGSQKEAIDGTIALLVGAEKTEREFRLSSRG